mmetsp:Transcript_19410/g.31628  ORF Transcript_19410/g.31628 Transcript_19410/m.31628 type:complete len:88 (-) Transcript_19410:161-424(-)
MLVAENHTQRSFLVQVVTQLLCHLGFHGSILPHHKQKERKTHDDLLDFQSVHVKHAKCETQCLEFEISRRTENLNVRLHCFACSHQS